MKQKTVIFLMFVAFTLMWACTPSSLRQDNKKGAAKAVGALPVPEGVTADQVAQAVPDAIAAAQKVTGVTVDSMMQMADSLKNKVDTGMVSAVSAKVDSLKQQVETQGLDPTLDSLLAKEGNGAAAKMKRDTTTMDSLELAIYKYNKVIDDSLRLDSLNRKKKNGIDSPVKYSANDSLTYMAGTGTAHLFGESHVEYQNMDLKSDRIYMVLDSSLVHATGVKDTVSNRLVKTPVFKMGSDEYESDTMAFNFKTKKGLIQQVYTHQDEGFLTSER